MAGDMIGQRSFTCGIPNILNLYVYARITKRMADVLQFGGREGGRKGICKCTKSGNNYKEFNWTLIFVPIYGP